MFENLLYQNASKLISDDIRRNVVPKAMLFSGPESSGKLTAAFEFARVISCQGPEKGTWQCTCPSCLMHKSLTHPDLVLAGPRDCTLEIAAARESLLRAVAQNASYTNAARYLFLRSVRKLTLRFSPVLLEDDSKTAKISPVLTSINESLEEIDFPHDLPDAAKLEKLLDSLLGQCEKLESGFMYDSIPIAQMRQANAWAHLTSGHSKKVLIIENADRMQDSVRNAMLKILEEPPEDVFFILTTSCRSAIMPTILSRVRTYNFGSRTEVQQRDVISRVFHAENPENFSGINSFLTEYLEVPANQIEAAASDFLETVFSGQKPDISSLVKEMNGFDPRLILKIFFKSLVTQMQKKLVSGSAEDPAILAMRTFRAQKVFDGVRETYQNITIYNQTPQAALENLYEHIR